MTFLNTTEDMDWLFEVHLPEYQKIRAQVSCAIIHGNEDSPEVIECFEYNHIHAPRHRWELRQNYDGYIYKGKE